jgi:hypothetical protein
LLHIANRSASAGSGHHRTDRILLTFSSRPPESAALLELQVLAPMRVGQMAQNWNGSTETDNLPSDDRWTVKLISFEALVSPTVTEMEPLHFSVRLFSLVDVVTIFSPRRYDGCCFDFSASELASLEFATVEFLAAYLTSALLWSSETVWSTAFRVSKESQSGLTSQPLRKTRKGKPKKTMDCLRKYGIDVRHAPA